MRILQVVHDFLPNHLAGVEIYTDVVSRQLAADHTVAILYSEVVPDAANYSLRRGLHGSIRTYELVNNHRFADFDETYVHPEIDRRLVEVLDEFRPDVVHIQHLLNLSLNLVAEARRRGIPTVMTLHDHWLTCANGGQRFHRRLGRCESLDAARCGSCIAKLHGVRRQNGRFLGNLAVLANTHRVALADRQPDASAAPDPSYVYQDRYPLDGEMKATWVAHPPARLVFRVHAGAPGVLVAAASMHPSTFDRAGGGVRFEVAVNGEEHWSRVLDPKRRPEDRTPARLEVPLEPGEVEIELRTEAVPPEDSAFCTAGWIDPHLSLADAGGARRRLADGSRRLIAWPERLAGRRRVRRRWQAVRRMARQVDLFVAPSRYLRNELIRFGLDPRQIIFSDYGFVTSGYQPRESLPEFGRRFIFVGSLVKHKGLHVLLEAFRAVPADARLDVCGSFDYAPSYSAELRAQCDHPGVRFLQQVPNERIPALLSEADCLVVPSIWTENSPLTIHEAFLSGVPVIASRLGGHVDLLAEGGGLLYDADDPEDLARQLLRVCREPGLLRELARGIPEVKPIDRHADELLGIYRNLQAGVRPVGTTA
jgi:glycosyltransferase involved in cell wall biosynthesis